MTFTEPVCVHCGKACFILGTRLKGVLIGRPIALATCLRGKAVDLVNHGYNADSPNEVVSA